MEVRKRAVDVLFSEAEITRGVAAQSMFDPIAPRSSWRSGLSCVSICPNVFDDNRYSGLYLILVRTISLQHSGSIPVKTAG